MWHQINSPEDVPNNLDVRLAVIDAKGTCMRLPFLAAAMARVGLILNYRGLSKSIPRIGRNGRKTGNIEIDPNVEPVPIGRRTLAGLPRSVDNNRLRLRLLGSTDMRNRLLGFRFGRCNSLRRKLKYRCFLTFQQIGQQHHLPVWKFQRIVMRSRVLLGGMSPSLLK
jgi:hypothetical protein